MDGEAGRAAKQFTQKLVAAAGSILITTTKPDKYDRYLADVFLFSDSTGITQDPIFLNNALLENGHAARSDGSIPADWMG
jgi:endonuclease YncB( thermonuclease family)